MLNKDTLRQHTMHAHSPYYLSGRLFCGKCGANITSDSGTNKQGRVHYYYKCTGKRKKLCDQKNMRKADLENLVFNATAKYVLKPEIIDKLAKEVALRFNAGLQKPTELMLLEKQQKDVQRAINGFLSAIAEGVVTSSTKDKLVELEEKNAKLQKKINEQMQKDTTPLSEEKVKAFLTHFANNKYDGEEAMSEFFNSFIYRVVLFEDCVYIFYNTSHDMPNKLRLEKNELADLKKFRSHRKSTLEPFGFKLGARGGERGI